MSSSDEIERRGFLRGGLSLGALTMLTGCAVTDKPAVQCVLQAPCRASTTACRRWLFDPNQLAPTFSEAEVLKPPRFNAFYGPEEVKPVDGATWKLELAGLIEDKRSLDQRRYLRDAREGDHHPAHLRRGLGLYRPVVGRAAALVPREGRAPTSPPSTSPSAAPTAIWQLDRHADGAAPADAARDEIRQRDRARPVRLSRCGCAPSTKLGFKNPKWITAIEVTNEYRGGYWEDQGFNWFSGI